MDHVRCVLWSDTHRYHDRVALPAGDLLVHAGDFCSWGAVDEAEAFASFLREQPHEHKVVIAGNHDRCLEDDRSLGPRLFDGWAHYLLDSGVELFGLRLWGSPWQPEFHHWAFNLPRGEPLAEKWALIPEGIDILVTHGPPHDVLDRNATSEPTGCEALALAIARVRPRLHVFGHIHEGYGAAERDGTLHVNACTCTIAYEPTNPPIVIDVPLDRALPARRV